MAFLCGPTKDHSHDLVVEARACVEGRLHPCFWLVERIYEGEVYEVKCGAPSIEHDWGFECKAGHSHVNADVRYREGWEYAECEDEAKALAKLGVLPVSMDGRSVYPL